MATRDELVSNTLTRLADTLVADFDLLDYLDLLLERSSVVLDAAAGGVMLADEQGNLQLLASSDEPTRLMELYELQRQDGPCLEAHRRGEAVAETALATSKRWPQFTSYALQLGFQATFAFPLRLRGEGIGALGLFRRQCAWSTTSCAASTGHWRLATATSDKAVSRRCAICASTCWRSPARGSCSWPTGHTRAPSTPVISPTVRFPLHP